MSRFFLPRHHKTHEEDGSDEIRGARLPQFGWPVREIVVPMLDPWTPGNDTSSWQTLIYDTTMRGGVRLQNGADGGPYTNGAYFSRLVSLGPRYSQWELRVGYASGGDCGIIQFALAPVPADPFGTLPYPTGTLTDASLVTFTDIGAPLDTYAAAALTDDFVAGHHYGIVLPAPSESVWNGTIETANANGQHPLTNAGPGYYRLRATVAGKNASSSDYRAALTFLALVRVDAGNDN